MSMKKTVAAIFEIKFDFEAEEAQELTVSEGELVRAPEDSERSDEPWTLVETVEPPFSKGFVPTSYLIPVRNNNQGSPPPPPPQQQQQQHQQQSRQMEMDSDYQDLSNTREQAPVRRLSDPRLAHQLLDALSIHPPEDHITRNHQDLIVHPTAAQTHQHVFAQHDRQFQQVMHMRHEQFKALEEATQDLTRRIEASKQKSVEIAEQMLDITEIIQGERRKWKEKLNEQVISYQEL